MTVDIRRRCYVTVTEPFLYLFHRDSVCKQKGSAAMSQIMESYPSKTVLCKKLWEAFR